MGSGARLAARSDAAIGANAMRGQAAPQARPARRARPRPVLLLAVLLVPVVLLVGACASSTTTTTSPSTTEPAPTVPPDRPLVLASTPLVGALVRSVAGDQADVRVLLPAGADPATAVAAQPAKGLDGADLLVVIDDATYETGLDLESTEAPWSTIPVLALAPQLNPVPLGGSELDPGTGTGATATDPHVWLDPDRWTQAARLVAGELRGLERVDPDTVDENVAAFDDAVARTDETLQATFATVADDDRTLVTDLPALAYLADRYGFELVVAHGPAALAAAATDRGATVVLVAASRRDDIAADLATSAPGLDAVGLDLDGASTTTTGTTTPGTDAAALAAVGTTTYTELLTTTAATITAALAD